MLAQSFLLFAIGFFCPYSVLAGPQATCIENTGGSCVFGDGQWEYLCYDWRGQTTCTGGRCFCTGGHCAGSDQACHDPATDPYKQIGGDFRIRNARWPDHYMDVDMDVDGFTGNVDVTSSPDGDDSKFTLWLPPSGAPQVNPLFLLHWKEWPDSAVVVTETQGEDAQTSYDTKTATVEDMDQTASWYGSDPAILSLGLKIMKAPVQSPEENRTLVMFESAMYSNMFVYARTGSWNVGGWVDDPGAGGYWYFDPPLPEDVQDSLPPYSGILCSYDCGNVDNLVDSALCASPSSMLTAFAGLVVLLGVIS